MELESTFYPKAYRASFIYKSALFNTKTNSVLSTKTKQVILLRLCRCFKENLSPVSLLVFQLLTRYCEPMKSAWQSTLKSIKHIRHKPYNTQRRTGVLQALENHAKISRMQSYIAPRASTCQSLA